MRYLVTILGLELGNVIAFAVRVARFAAGDAV